MSRLWAWLFLGASLIALAQQPVQATSQDADVMLAAVSRNQYMFTGGIGPDKWTGKGTVEVEPLGYITESGEWKALPCSKDWLKTCPKFAREYLSKPHTYTVVSADGQGAMIQSAPTTLSECHFYNGPGTYTGASIANSAIAASSTDLFAEAAPLLLLSGGEARPIRDALSRLVPQKLDSIHRLRIFTLRLEGQELLAVQRSYSDIATAPEGERYEYVFVVGNMDESRFHVLHRKKNTEDEVERILGTIHLKSGRDFLITTVSDPESQWFRVYGIRNGHLTLIYSGGGSSC
ncbi:MAG TPA: hypothetical protein VKG86_09815 [Terracidiphilus sp.]|nr:hypothetical protein [Terracidiphilus sp.]